MEKAQNAKNVKSKPVVKEVKNSVPAVMAKALSISMAITLIVFIIYAILLTYTNVSEKNINTVAILCTVLSTAVAGFDCARGIKSRGLLWGILSGGIYAIIIFIIGIASGEGGFSFTGRSAVTIIVALAGGGIGGIFGVNKK